MGVALVVSLLGSLICSVIAASKNRNTGGWAVLALLLPVISILIVACLGAVPIRESVAASPPPSQPPRCWRRRVPSASRSR